MKICVQVTACFLLISIFSHTGFAQDSTSATTDATVTPLTDVPTTGDTTEVTTPTTSATTTPQPTTVPPTTTIEITNAPPTSTEATTNATTPQETPATTPDAQSISTQSLTSPSTATGVVTSSVSTTASTVADTKTSSPSTASASTASVYIPPSPTTGAPTVVPHTSSAAPTTTGTTVPTTTKLPKLTTKFPSKDTTAEISHYILSLNVGPGKYIKSTLNSTLVQKEIEEAFKATTGFSNVKHITKGLADGEMQFDVVYSLQKLLADRKEDDTANQTQREITAALQTLNSSADFNVSSIDGDFQKYISDFAARTTNLCDARQVCELGYVCKLSIDGAKCTHACEYRDCGSHGQCELVITGQGEATTQCKCTADDRNVYSGDDCQYEKMHPDIMMAIIGGVLGGLCFLLLIVIYCVCCRSKRKQEKQYTLNQNAHYNESYESPSNLQMKNV